MDDQMQIAAAPAAAPMGGVATEPNRDDPAANVTAEERALVSKWCSRLAAARKFHEDAFKKMREDMEWARLGASKEWVAGGNYTVPIVQRHINQAVASLYAKNPQAVAKRRRRLAYRLWDGRPESIQAAMANPISPASQALIAELLEVHQKNEVFDRIARTLQFLFNYFLDEQEPVFKVQAKQLVRRVKTCGVGYIKLGYQRQLQKDSEITAQIADTSDKIQRLQALMAEAQQGEIEQGSANLAELQSLLGDLQSRETVIVREGPVFGFPGSTRILVDPKCTLLKGFIGADWLSEELLLTPDQVKERYKVDIGTNFTAHKPDCEQKAEKPDDATGTGQKSGDLVLVSEIQYKKGGQTMAVVDGYPAFLRVPATPIVQIPRFWTIFAVTFNDIESETEIFPPSDVRLLRDPQADYNRARQGLREHRMANRPWYAASKGALDEPDKERLSNHAAHEVVELMGLQPGQPIESLLQRGANIPIDPAQYDVGASFVDIERSIGTQQANLGGTSGATATESSIAENGRISTVSSNSDDLDDTLSALARSAGHLMLMEMDPAYVQQLAGPGAVWPDIQRQEAAEECYIEIKAGSSGRPNKAAEISNRERAMPFLLQFPGINPTPIARDYLELLDIDTEEAIVDGLPSIVALNAAASRGGQVQPGTGNPATEPTAQGGSGGQNASKPAQNEPQGQPAYPTRTE